MDLQETGVGLNYQSIGSGGGIKQIQAKTVVFGATDAPSSGAELDKSGLVQFPMVMGGIVPVFNLPGIGPGEIVIDGSTLGKIFLGQVKTWDDAALKKLNPNAKLPSQAIAVVHRSDGSGTTQLHRLSHQCKPGLEVQGGFGGAGGMADGHRRQGQ
jgi:phosphate transport system substrate-binding protein